MVPVPNLQTPEIRADRSLLVPGPHPPFSHLGATLLRYAVHSALRYALYQLGQAVPESPPTRFVALRLYLDAPSLRDCLGTQAGSQEILGALLNPGGTAVEPLPKRLRGALWFHRLRLTARSAVRGISNRSSTGSRGSSRSSSSPTTRLTELLPALGEALLGDLIAALDRRQLRAAGKDMGPVQSLQAARFLEGCRADLSRLGLPDPILPSWRDSKPPLATGAPGAWAPAALCFPSHRLRGGFREQYRRLLDLLRPSLLALGGRAMAKGHLVSVDDLFFLPLDLINDLEGASKPKWLDGAIESNREEWQELRGRKAPADTLGNVEPPRRPDLPADLAPLWPLV